MAPERDDEEVTVAEVVWPFVVSLITLAAVVALVLSTGCAAHVPVPDLPPSPIVPPRTVQVTVRMPNGHPLLTAQVSLSDDYQHLQACPVSEEGRAICVLDGPQFFGVQVYLTVAAEGYKARRFVFIGAASDQLFEDVILDREVPPMNRLVRDGQFFRLETGERWTAIENSDFNLLGRFVAGEDIRPIVAQRAATGRNLLRVFTAYSICPDGYCPPSNQPIGRLVPREHPELYDQIPAFLDVLAVYQMRAELVGFTGPYPGVLDSDDEKVQHWQRLCAAAQQRPASVLLERVNEGDHPANRDLPWSRLPKCDGVLSSAGSATADHLPMQPYWDYATYHPGFSSEWMRKAIHNGWEDVAEKANIPVLVNETTRFPDNDSSLEHAYDVGRGCALMMAGCAFHSVAGKRSGLWDGLELALAQAWGDGAKSIDLACQAGAYRRYVDDRFLRVYDRIGVPANCRVEVRR